MQDKYIGVCRKAAKKAIEAMGGVTMASRTLGIPKSTIHSWGNSGIPERRLEVVALASGISAESLRPDLHEIEQRRMALARAASQNERQAECNAKPTADTRAS